MSKAIDRQCDDYEARCAVAEWLRPRVEGHGFAEVTAHFGFKDETMARARWTSRSQPNTPTLAQWAELKSLLSLPDDMDAEVWRLNGRKGQPGENWEKREKIGERDVPVGHAFAGPTYGGDSSNQRVDETAPATPEAQRWQGWGTALKPAHEPIVVARKPLVGTVSRNVAEFGTGALNIDATRIGGGGHLRWSSPRDMGYHGGTDSEAVAEESPTGRWPANVCLSHLPSCQRVGERRVKVKPDGGAHAGTGAFPIENPKPVGYAPDGLETVEAWSCAPGCPVAELDRQSGESKSTGGQAAPLGRSAIYGDWAGEVEHRDPGLGDFGGASRYFATFPWKYQAKASRAERNAGLEGFEERELPHSAAMKCATCGLSILHGERQTCECEAKQEIRQSARNSHPTVKPVDLMRWLVRLVTPPGGRILDPFTGSGSTGIAAILEGFEFVGVEREADYCRIAEARIAWWDTHKDRVEEILALSAKSERERQEHATAGQLGLEIP